MNSNSSYNNNNKNNISKNSNNAYPEKPLKDEKSPLGSPFYKAININYAINAIKCSRKKNFNKDSKMTNNLKKNFLTSIENQVYKNLSKKYNYTLDKYNLLCINYLLSNRSCRLVCIFKEKMITDYIDEFLKRKYSFKESKERIPKFYLYYKHYSIFFGQPFFNNFCFNALLQKNGEKKARIYYKNHYQNGESKDEDNENIGFAESGSEDEEEEKKNNNDLKKNNKNTIFSSGIKDNIDNVTLMTTINSFENNTINLGLNNEKIEIFSENKMEKSNDTTIGELMDDINKGIEEANKDKINNIFKKKKKKNFSLGDNFFSIIKKNINNNITNENIKNKKKLIDLINNNNIKKNIKNNSIKKKLFYVGHQNINFNCGQIMSSDTQRYNHTKNSTSIKKDNLNKKKIILNNNINSNINSNKAYKKRKLLSYTNEEVNKLIEPTNPNKYKSPRQGNNNINLNNNYLNTINANTIYGYKKFSNIKKINSPLSINKKKIISNNNNINSNTVLISLNSNRNNNKIKICKTLKSFADKNKKIKNISKNIINKDLATISGDKKKKINKLSFKKFDFENLTETHIFKDKTLNKKTKGRNIISPLNNKCSENYTMNNNEYSNNLPFSANKNKNWRIFNNQVFYNDLTYQTINTINNEQGIGHQRTKSNLIQGIVKKNINNNNPTFSKILNTEMNNAYIKPAIRIKKNDKLYVGRPILNDTNIDNYENKTTIDNHTNNNKVFNFKKISQNNAKYSNIINSNNTNLKNEFKNNNNIHNNNLKNTNFNKYILEVIKKTKHQHYNSLTNQINPTNTLNLKENILSKNKKRLANINLNNSRGHKDKDVLEIALSLFVNQNTSRNNYNQTNIVEPPNTNNNINAFCKINNNQIMHSNQNNNNKKNYNLNININNEININENNTINNSTYINHTHRLNSKNLIGCKNFKNYFGDISNKQKEKNKYIANLKQKKYNIDIGLNNNRNNICQSTKNNNTNDNLIFNMNNKNMKIKKRNYENKNFNNALSSINNNYINTFILNNNSVDNNNILGNNNNNNKILNNINNKNINKNINKNNNNNNNNNTIKSYHTKSVTSLSDLMFHNKRLISLYKNLSKSK